MATGRPSVGQSPGHPAHKGPRGGPGLWTTGRAFPGPATIPDVLSQGELTGIFIGSHAIAAGRLTRRELRARGYLRLVQGVYTVPQEVFDHQLRARGAALVLPPGAAIGGLSAAAWYGAPFATTLEPVTVVVPSASSWRGPRGVRAHRTSLRPGDVTDLDDVRITSPLRTAWDVAALEPLGTAVAVLDAMVRGGHLTLDALRRMVALGVGRWRVTRVRRAVDLVDPRAESGPESRVRVAMVQGGLDPVVQLDIEDAEGRFVARVDFAFPEQRLVVEYEGEHHFDPERIRADQVRLAKLAAAGWRVIRLHAPDLWRLPEVVVSIRSALAFA